MLEKIQAAISNQELSKENLLYREWNYELPMEIFESTLTKLKQ